MQLPFLLTYVFAMVKRKAGKKQPQLTIVYV